MNKITVTDWAVVYAGDNHYQAPELQRPSIAGTVYGHPKYPNGKRVVTSIIKDVKGREVYTHNSIYVLVGDPTPEYLQWMTEHGYEYDPEKPINLKTDNNN